MMAYRYGFMACHLAGRCGVAMCFYSQWSQTCKAAVSAKGAVVEMLVAATCGYIAHIL
jgi:hypothetical protein